MLTTIHKNVSSISPSESKSVCLTFDDGPDPAFTPGILDVLADHGAKASFFVIGEAAARFPQLVERLLRDGHSLGNHTYTHPHPWTVFPARARDELSQTTRLLTAIAGQPPRWFRPPHGRLRRAMLQQARTENMSTVLWSLTAIDWGPLGTEKGIGERLSKIQPGDIVLMHDGKRTRNHPENTLRQLPALLQRLIDQQIPALSLDQVQQSSSE